MSVLRRSLVLLLCVLAFTHGEGPPPGGGPPPEGGGPPPENDSAGDLPDGPPPSDKPPPDGGPPPGDGTFVNYTAINLRVFACNPAMGYLWIDGIPYAVSDLINCTLSGIVEDDASALTSYGEGLIVDESVTIDEDGLPFGPPGHGKLRVGVSKFSLGEVSGTARV